MESERKDMVLDHRDLDPRTNMTTETLHLIVFTRRTRLLISKRRGGTD